MGAHIPKFRCRGVRWDLLINVFWEGGCFQLYLGGDAVQHIPHRRVIPLSTTRRSDLPLVQILRTLQRQPSPSRRSTTFVPFTPVTCGCSMAACSRCTQGLV